VVGEQTIRAGLTAWWDASASCAALDRPNVPLNAIALLRSCARRAPTHIDGATKFLNSMQCSPAFSSLVSRGFERPARK